MKERAVLDHQVTSGVEKMSAGCEREEKRTTELLSICGPIEPTLQKLILACVRAAYSQGWYDGKWES